MKAFEIARNKLLDIANMRVQENLSVIFRQSTVCVHPKAMHRLRFNPYLDQGVTFISVSLEQEKGTTQHLFTVLVGTGFTVVP